MSYPRPHAMIETVAGWTTAYVLRSYALADVPLRIRPAMLFLTAGWLLVLGVLGLAPLPEMPINDKALHFFGLGFATFLIYFVLEVPEGPHRRIWYYRRAPLLLTLFLGFFCGGVLSEFFQAMLPWKTFQAGDIAANLAGAGAALYGAHALHRRARRRAELRGLYRPLDARTYRDAQGRTHAYGAEEGGEGGEGGWGAGGAGAGQGPGDGAGLGRGAQGAVRLDPRRLETVDEGGEDVWDDEASEGEGEGEGAGAGGTGAGTGEGGRRDKDERAGAAGAAFALGDDDLV